jgi:hypothetical protein
MRAQNSRLPCAINVKADAYGSSIENFNCGQRNEKPGDRQGFRACAGLSSYIYSRKNFVCGLSFMDGR